MASLQYGFSNQILREFTARDLNEIIFVEKQRSAGKNLAAKIFQNQTRFSILQTQAEKQKIKQKPPRKQSMDADQL
jgi:hypothetical protein